MISPEGTASLNACREGNKGLLHLWVDTVFVHACTTQSLLGTTITVTAKIRKWTFPKQTTISKQCRYLPTSAYCIVSCTMYYSGYIMRSTDVLSHVTILLHWHVIVTVY